ncbi:MAG TPA: creatininase family protein, partial [Candidatus Krumholzibacteria bacterium]|nr:creatininase family protein [Candidatus Krumholzibacteria bacterium]
SVASPLTRKWGRTLSDEFKRGACHAGEYETSIVLAADRESVRDDIRASLPPVDISLSDGIAQGRQSFTEMGMTRSYSGDPARASAAHGAQMLSRLSAMIVGEVTAALA